MVVTVIGSALSSAAIIMGGLIFCARALWRIRGSWDETNTQLALTSKTTAIQLQSLINDVKEIVLAKQQEHARLEARIDRGDDRMSRHEQWHNQH